MTDNEATRLAELIEQLKRLLPAAYTADAGQDADMQHIRAFVSERLQPDPKLAITSASIWRVYAEDMDQRVNAKLPQNRFLRLLPAAMFAEFSVPKSHRVPTNSGAARGFLGVCFRTD